MPRRSVMKPSNRNVGHDPTIMGNERPRRDRDDDHLSKDARVQDEDPRNGLNRPASDASSRDDYDDEDD
jgi:hypothetical protein